jgi:hypothetical protein
MPGSVPAFARLLEVLHRLEVPYAVGGSLASSAHGIPRTALDIDLVVDLSVAQIEPFAQELRRCDFHADPEQIREAFAQPCAASLVHLQTAWKFDLFPLQSDEYSQASFARRTFIEIATDAPGRVKCAVLSAAVLSAEDTLLRKLEFYRAEGESSDRQWTDLRGICAVTGAELDLGYLRRWAQFLWVSDLLESLLAECGLAK